MKMRKRSLWVIAGAWILLGLLANGYTPRTAAAQPQTGLMASRVERIGVMPFLKGRYGSEIGEIADGLLSQLYFSPERVSRDCDRVLTGCVHEALQKRHGERAIPLEKVLEAYKGISKDEATDTLRTLARSSARPWKLISWSQGLCGGMRREVEAPRDLLAPHPSPLPSFSLMWQVGGWYGGENSMKPNVRCPRAFWIPKPS